MRRAGEGTLHRIVRCPNFGVAEPGYDRKPLSKLSDFLQIGSQRVALAGGFREEVLGMDAQRRTDADHAAWDLRLRAAFCLALQPRQSQTSPGSPQKMSASKA